MNWLLCIWRRTEMIWTCREGVRARCGATDRLNERGMRNSTLLIPLVIIGLLLLSAQHKCIALLRKHELCGNHRLGSLAAFEIRNWKSPIQCFDLISIGKSACPLEHIPLKNPDFTAKSNLQYDRYDSRAGLEWQQITVITCNFCWQKGKLG